jgi:outer membrane cobalamin receptor
MIMNSSKNQLVKVLSILLCSFFALTSGYAQNLIVKGTVIDSQTEKPIAFANIVLSNSIIGTISGYDGTFTFEIPSKMKTESLSITCTHIGYLPMQVNIDKDKSESLILKLLASEIRLSEVAIQAEKNTLSNLERTTIPILLSDKDIAMSGAQNIPELLLKQPGISLAGQNYHAAPSIRGLARKRVVVLVNGEKVSSERNVGPPGTFVNPFEIERLEILKGPYSTLYGSDAIGGVVNIVTKTYEQGCYNDNIGGRLDLSYKSVDNGINSNLAVNGKTNKIKYNLSAGYREADNYKTPDGNTLMNTFFKEKHVAGNLIYQLNNKNQIAIKTYYSNGGPIGKPAYDTLTNSQHNYDDHFIAGVNYKSFNITPYLTKSEINITRHEHKLGAKIIKHKQELIPDDDKLVNNQKDLEGVDYIAQWDLYFTFSEKFKMLAGFDGYFRTNLNFYEYKVVRNYNTGLFIKEEDNTLLENGLQHSYGIFTKANYLLSTKWLLRFKLCQ